MGNESATIFLCGTFRIEDCDGRRVRLPSAKAQGLLALVGAGYNGAEGKYRDFQTRFPTSRRAAYVQYQIANSLIERLEKLKTT